MSGHEFETSIAVTDCGCGGRGIAWQQDIPFTGRQSVQVFCSKHCGVHIGPYPVHDRKDGNQLVRKWNRAMSGTPAKDKPHDNK